MKKNIGRMAKYSLIEYSSEWFKRWNQFVENSNNGTIFHRLDFLNYHGDKFKNEENNLIWLKGETIIAIMPAIKITVNDLITLNSPFGGSFGGIVISKKFKSKHTEIISDLFLQYIQSRNIETVSLTFEPTTYYALPNELIYYSLERRGFKITKRDIFNIIQLKNNPEKFYEGRARTIIRNVDKDFEIMKNPDIEEFYEILKQDKKRLKQMPTHTIDDLKILISLFPDRINIDIAEHIKTKAKAGVLYIETKKGHTIMTFYIAQEDKAKGLNGPSYILHRSIQKYAAKGYQFFDFGSSSFGYQIQNPGLAEFKESFGANGYTRIKYLWNTQTT
jgi:hypothetical protein